MGATHGSVLRILRDDGPQSRAELARRSSLSPTTLTHVTARLLKDGSIIESATPGLHAIGRPAQALRLAPDAYTVAGVHIGAGHVQVTLADLRADAKGWRAFDFAVEGADPAIIVDRVAGEVAGLVEEAQIDRKRLIGVGLSVPGSVDAQRREAVAAVNLGWNHVPFAEMIEQRTGLPAIVEHNVSAMALAESRYGLGRGVAALLFVYLRFGLGAGLVIDGKPFRPGGRGTVELGHIQTTATDGSGASFFLESFLRESTLMRLAGLEGAVPPQLLAHVEKNALAWDAVVGHLSAALGIAVNLLTPDVVVFGGHLGEAPESLFERLRADLPHRVSPHMREMPAIHRSGFGFGAGAIGGAAVALDHFFYSGALH